MCVFGTKENQKIKKTKLFLCVNRLVIHIEEQSIIYQQEHKSSKEILLFPPFTLK